MGGFTDDEAPTAPSQGGFADDEPVKVIPPLRARIVDGDWPVVDFKPFLTKRAKNVYGSCAVCGGSDHPQIGLFSNPPFSGRMATGHKLGCPRGKVGTVIGVEDA